jgi:peptidyl-prolyl cis-trans isomerase B (cyclophilin B)
MKKITSLFVLMTLCFSIVIAKPKKEKNTYIKFQTTKGDLILKLYNETPKHRDNMIELVKGGFYDSILFHRVIKNFMIQGGDPESKKANAQQSLGNGEAPNRKLIPAEFNPNLIHRKGVLAAARDNNPEKSSSNCQFYIVQGRTFKDTDLDMMEQRSGWKYTAEQRNTYKTIGGTPHLDNNYTVYGELVNGFEALDAIASVKTGAADRPEQDVRITKAVVLKKYKTKKTKCFLFNF